MISVLRGTDSSPEVRHLLELRLRIEKRRAIREDWFDLGALSLGLLERLPQPNEHRRDLQFTN